MVEHRTKTSWVELCLSDFEQSIIWFEQVLGFRVVAREANVRPEPARVKSPSFSVV